MTLLLFGWGYNLVDSCSFSFSVSRKCCVVQVGSWCLASLGSVVGVTFLSLFYLVDILVFPGSLGCSCVGFLGKVEMSATETECKTVMSGGVTLTMVLTRQWFLGRAFKIQKMLPILEHILSPSIQRLGNGAWAHGLIDRRCVFS